MRSVALPTQIRGLWIVPSTVDLAGAEIELVPVLAREMKLREALEPVRDAYDFVLIDCPPSLGLLTINALAAADSVLVPIQCEYYALEGVGQLMSTIKIVQSRLNRNLVLEGVVLTMFDARTNLSIQVVEEVKKFFKDKVYSTIVPRNVRLSEAPSHGKPIILYDTKSKGAEVYRELSREVIANAEKRAG
jgi:chromosome partitioning protein